MVVALVGGVLPAIVGRRSAGSCSPTGTSRRRSTSSRSHEAENLLALVVYVVAAGIVAVLVDRVGRSRMRAAAAAGRGRGAGRARRRAGPARVGGRHARPAARDVRVPRRRAARDATAATAGRVVERPGAEPPTRSRRRRRQPRPRARRRRSPSPAATLIGRGPAGAQRLRRPGRRGRRARAAATRGRPRPSELAAANDAAGRAAAGRLPRPAHAAGVDQGVDLQPAPARRRLAAGRRSTSSRRRSRRRPTG